MSRRLKAFVIPIIQKYVINTSIKNLPVINIRAPENIARDDIIMCKINLREGERGLASSKNPMRNIKKEKIRNKIVLPSGYGGRKRDKYMANTIPTPPYKATGLLCHLSERG